MSGCHRRRSIAALVLAAAMAIVLVAHADQRLTRAKVPTPVLAAFARAYPRAVIRGYNSEIEAGVKRYEIESLDAHKTRDVLYKADGTVAEVEEGRSGFDCA